MRYQGVKEDDLPKELERLSKTTRIWANDESASFLSTQDAKNLGHHYDELAARGELHKITPDYIRDHAQGLHLDNLRQHRQEATARLERSLAEAHRPASLGRVLNGGVALAGVGLIGHGAYKAATAVETGEDGQKRRQWAKTVGHAAEAAVGAALTLGAARGLGR